MRVPLADGGYVVVRDRTCVKCRRVYAVEHPAGPSRYCGRCEPTRRPRVTGMFACGHPVDIWHTGSRMSEGRQKRYCVVCARSRGRRRDAAVVGTVRCPDCGGVMPARSQALRKGYIPAHPCVNPRRRAAGGRWGKRREGLILCGRCIRIAPVGHECPGRSAPEPNWSGVICPACGEWRYEPRQAAALRHGCGSVQSLNYRRNPSVRQKVIDASKHRIHLKRAAQERGEAITIAELIERDGDCCYLCGRQVSDALPFTHPLKANIEHVVPLSRGGTHTLDNVRVACRSCNSAKGAKVAA